MALNFACLWGGKLLLFLLEQRVDDMLFLFHVLLVLFKPVTVAFNVDDSAVMQYPVEDGGGDRNLREDFIPLGEGLI
jgi:hypothetical protein